MEFPAESECENWNNKHIQLAYDLLYENVVLSLELE